MLQSVSDASQISEARRVAAQLGRDIGMAEEKVARVMLVATEMATNLLKHGGGGEIVIERFADSDGTGLELIALDKGPGMANVARCLTDGFSMNGSPGTGLGAMERQSDRFAIFSHPGKGTAVMARFRVSRENTTRSEVGAVAQPYRGERVSGDHWAFGASQAGPTFFAVDGSGHGPEALRAADVAIETFHGNIDRDCVSLAQAIHRALTPTRGAAIALARIDPGERLVRFVGIGNIGAAVVRGGRTHRMISHGGVAGHVAPRVREFTYPYAERPLLIFHSDGVSARWDLDDYPGLAASAASLVAGVLFRDFRRASDDALIVAARVAA
jgi:anti-sigma regulatory factor (Ser/Thr protein kinase)